MKRGSETRKQRSVTLADIAVRCGVTKATVFHVVHGNRQQVSDATYRRIIAVVQELGYDPASQQAARRLSLQKQGQRVLNRVVAMLFPRHFLRHPYYWRILQGMMDVFTAESFGVLSDYDNSSALCGRMLPVYARGEVDGAIVIANPESFKAVLDHIRSLPGFGERPVVSLIEPMEGCSLVAADDRAGAREAAQHLLDLGHRRILRFSHPTDREGTARSRFLGHEDACRAAGIDSRSVFSDFTHWVAQDRERARDLIFHAMDVCPDATAILAPNDPGAVRIAEFLEERGLNVPDDISLIGYDDTMTIPGADRENILTTVHVPLEEIGEQAARMMIELVATDELIQKQLLLPPHLVIRGSTASLSRRKPHSDPTKAKTVRRRTQLPTEDRATEHE